jgi:xanthine dehydrogenase accessory factor
MKEFQAHVQQWWLEAKQVALARVIETWGSSPRPVGSCMFISSDGDMLGSVSGGCVEGAVVRAAKKVIETNSLQVVHFGIADEDAWAVGLSCGGQLRVCLQPWPDDGLTKTLFDAAEHAGLVWTTQLTDGVPEQKLYTPLDLMVNDAMRVCYDHRISKVLWADNQEVFVQVFPPRSRLLIIGAAHIAADLLKWAHDFDFETVVIDPRQAFANQTTLPVKPDKLLQAYPSEVLNTLPLDAHTYAVILSHDPKIDDDALNTLLRKPVAYIGALGSKKNHDKRVKRLEAAGFSASAIARIDAPIGVDIGARGAKQIALSIMAKLIQVRNRA